MNELYTQVGNDAYHLQFNTNSKNNFEAIQAIARMCVLGQEVTLTNYESINIQKRKNIEFVPMRHGYWKDSGLYPTCSLCNAYFDRYDDSGDLQIFSYCPACGAKMDLQELYREE